MEKISLDTVKMLLDRAVEKTTKEYRKSACISIYDENGFLLGFYRMDGAPIRSIQISQSKAYTAIRMGVSTDAFLERLRKDNIDVQHFCDPLMTPLPGGSLLKDKSGKIVGAVGVSGMALPEDQAVANDVAGFAGTM